MSDVFSAVIDRCRTALESDSAQPQIAAILLEAAGDPEIANAIAAHTNFSSLEDLATYRSDRLTLLAGALPPGFRAAPHNHFRSPT